MRGFKGKLAIILLACSWLLLFWLTGSRTPWRDVFAEQDGHISISLGDVPVQQYHRMGFTSGIVRHNPHKNYWLVGTEQGNVLAVDMKGRIIWKRNFGIGKITALAFSRDGQRIYVGEQSPTGQVYALSADNGDVLWRFSSADGVGSEPSLRSNPTVTRIVVDTQDRVYLSAYRFQMNGKAKKDYFSKLYALDKQANVLWQYPPNKVMDSWVNWFDLADSYDTLAFSTCNYDLQDDMQYLQNLYFLDTTTQTIKREEYIQPLQPFKRTVMRSSPNYSADGKYLTGIASDGRGFLFDTQGNLIWQAAVASPRNLNGDWLNAIGRESMIVGQNVVFTTLNTFNRNNWQLSTPVEHPGDNSIFVFDLQGNFQHKYKAAGNIEDINSTEQLLAAAIGRNVRLQTYQGHGAMLINLGERTEPQLYPTPGPLQSVAISANRKFLAGIETPAQTESGKIIGEYRLHIWEIEPNR